MKQRVLIVLSSMALGLLAWGAGSALAHHSVSATYIFGKTVTARWDAEGVHLA